MPKTLTIKDILTNKKYFKFRKAKLILEKLSKEVNSNYSNNVKQIIYYKYSEDGLIPVINPDRKEVHYLPFTVKEVIVLW